MSEKKDDRPRRLYIRHTSRTETETRCTECLGIEVLQWSVERPEGNWSLLANNNGVCVSCGFTEFALKGKK